MQIGPSFIPQTRFMSSNNPSNNKSEQISFQCNLSKFAKAKLNTRKLLNALDADRVSFESKQLTKEGRMFRPTQKI